MDAVPFPNSVNAPSPIVIKDKIIDMERINQISRNSSAKVAATTNYSEFLYKYHNGVVMKTMVKVSHQNYLDIKA